MRSLLFDRGVVLPFRPKVWLRHLALPGSGKSSTVDPRFKRILWQLIGGTRGGPNRARIIRLLLDKPCNANQLSKELALDYKTVQHHIKALIDNGLIVPSKEDGYAALYFLTSLMQDHIDILNEILAKIG